MLTQGEDVEAHALRERGWSISAIARHLGHDRKTIRGYLNGDRQPGYTAQSPSPTRWRWSRTTSGSASPTTPTSGPAPSTTRSSLSATRCSYPSFVRQIRERRPASALRGVPRREGQRHHRDRPSAGRGDPVGLVRATKRAVGGDRLCAARHPAAFGSHPRRAGRILWTRPISSRPWTR